MCSLGLFPSPPPPLHHRTLCEKDGHLVAVPPTGLGHREDVARYTDRVSAYPEVTISRAQLHPAATIEDGLKSAFLVDTGKRLARVFTAFKEHGTISALEEFVAEEEKSVTSWPIRVVEVALSFVHWTRFVRGSICPHSMLSTDDLLQKFTLASDWRDGLVRCFAWHPHVDAFAYALHDDTVRMMDPRRTVTPVLKHHEQRKVADITFRPFAGSTLAVACHRGVLVWQLDPESVLTRPSSSCTRLLRRPGHEPVTSIQWSPCGRLLVSASPRDCAMIVWEVVTALSVPLRRLAGGGVSLLRWSPDGRLLLAATPSNIFRVWETTTWNCDWWSTGSGHCVAACWSPDGSVLLTAMRDEPVVYALSFADSGDRVGGSTGAIPFVSLAPVTYESRRLSVGGPVQSMVWDKTGHRLALSFSCGETRQELIAVFRTRTKPMLHISPCGFVQGGHGEVPQCMQFRDEFVGGALLTVCWSSGEVAHIPFLFRAETEDYAS